MRIYTYFLLISLLSWSAPHWAFGDAEYPLDNVSLINLIANPEKYHRKRVRVIGVGNLEFEGNNLWTSKEALRHRVLKNAVWIEPNFEKIGASQDALSKFNGRYVLIEGTFNKDNTGHMGLSSAAIENVTRYQLWEK